MRFLLGALLLLLPGVNQGQAAEDVSEFFGMWVPADQYHLCDVPRPWGEGPHIEIKQDYFMFGDGAPCEDVGMWLADGNLRVSAACRNEAGIRNFNGELRLREDGTFTIGSSAAQDENGGTGYKRCKE